MADDVKKYPWYEEIETSDTLTQGDIIDDCPIPLVNASVYRAVIDGSGEAQDSLQILKPRVIVLSQACDIEQEKISTIIVCPMLSVAEVQMKNPGFIRDRLESVRQGREPSLHLLNEFHSDTFHSEWMIVDFHHIYSLPKDYMKEIALVQRRRLRLLPPYREHLSQAFARYFMRIGLPVDISRDALQRLGT